jgi:hypothetical protein
MHIKKKSGFMFVYRNGSWELLMVYLRLMEKDPDARAERLVASLWWEKLGPFPVRLLPARRTYLGILAARSCSPEKPYVKFPSLDMLMTPSFYKIRKFEKVSRKDLPLFMDWQTGAAFEKCMKGETLI